MEAITYCAYRIDPVQSVKDIGSSIASFTQRFGFAPETLVVYTTTVVPKDLSLRLYREDMQCFTQAIYLGPVMKSERSRVLPDIPTKFVPMKGKRYVRIDD